MCYTHKALALGYSISILPQPPVSRLDIKCPPYWVYLLLPPDRIPLKKRGPRGKRNGWWLLVLGSLPDFLSTLGTKVHLDRRTHCLAASGPTTPRAKLWILDRNPTRVGESCLQQSSPLPSRQARWLPNPRDFRRRRPDCLGTRLLSHRDLTDRRQDREASFSLCKVLGSFLSFCILLAILYPVWEFQKHLQLSFVQPHMCRPKGSIMFLPATPKTQKSGVTTPAGLHLPLLQRPGTSQTAW